MSDAWTRALTGDRDAFQEAVAPHQPALLAAARRQLALGQAAGTLAADALTPEELVGETLLSAHAHRGGFDPRRMRLRAWLLGVQTRTLARVARMEARYTGRKALSLDEPVGPDRDADAVEESLYEFHDPFETTTVGDLLPGSMPTELEAGGVSDAMGLRDAALSDDERDALADAGLDPDDATALLLHDEFDLSVDEVAQILDAQLDAMAERVNQARLTLRDRLGTGPAAEPDDRPTDSYTGERLA